MKPNLFIFIALIFFAGPSLYSAELTLYPVEQGRIIVDKQCELNAPLKWDKELLKSTNGLKTGDDVLEITPTALRPSKVGELSCFAGQCHGDFVSINLSPGGSDVIGVLKKSEASSLHVTTIQVAPLKISECDELLAGIVNKSDKEVPAERKCQRVTIPNDATIIIGSKGFMQINGWVVHIVKTQVQQPHKGPIVDVDWDTNPLEPALALVDEFKKASLLWGKSSGMCCPSAVTLVTSKIDSKGNISFGHAYKAGGQPCD